MPLKRRSTYIYRRRTPRTRSFLRALRPTFPTPRPTSLLQGNSRTCVTCVTRSSTRVVLVYLQSPNVHTQQHAAVTPGPSSSPVHLYVCVSRLPRHHPYRARQCTLPPTYGLTGRHIFFRSDSGSFDAPRSRATRLAVARHARKLGRAWPDALRSVVRLLRSSDLFFAREIILKSSSR